jgi:hypothetical protein
MDVIYDVFLVPEPRLHDLLPDKVVIFAVRDVILDHKVQKFRLKSSEIQSIILKNLLSRR